MVAHRRKKMDLPKRTKENCTFIHRYRGEIKKCRLKAREGSTRCHVHAPPSIEQIYTKVDICCGVASTPEQGGPEGGWCTHAFNIKEWDDVLTIEQKKERRMRSICGVLLEDLPDSEMKDGWVPGCLRCQKKLIKMKLITEEELK